MMIDCSRCRSKYTKASQKQDKKMTIGVGKKNGQVDKPWTQARRTNDGEEGRKEEISGETKQPK